MAELGRQSGKVLLIGDSIRIGYEKYVHDKMRNYARVRAPKQNTYSSVDVLSHFDDWIANSGSDVIHINCGLHDIKRDRTTGQIAVEYELYARNVENILLRIVSEITTKVIWATTTPIVEKWHNSVKEFDRFLNDVNTANDIAVRICEKHRIRINDLYSLAVSLNPESVILPDGVHFTEAGYSLLGDQVTHDITEYL